MISQQLEKSLKELKVFIQNLNKKHEWCIAHNEGLSCHLDDEQDNQENIVPDLKHFLITHTLNILEAERERLEESKLLEVMVAGGTTIREKKMYNKALQKQITYLDQQIKTIREMITN